MYTTEQVNYFIVIIGLSVSLAILLFLRTSGDRDSRLNRLFTRLIVCNIASMVLTIVSQWFAGFPIIFIQRIVGFVAYAVVNLLLPLLADYIFALIERNTKFSRMMPRIIYIAYGIWLISMVVSEFNGMYFYLDENNMPVYGELFWVSMMYAAFSLLFITVVVLHYRKNLGRNDVLYLLLLPVLSIIAIIIQIIMGDDLLALIYLTNALFALFCYGGIQARQAKLLKDRELELNEARVAVMLSQIQPHFLYNSLTAIQELYFDDPEAAREAISEFSRYLRGNFDSLELTKPIPFSRELEHVETYLALEKKRFDYKLNIVYDIQASGFMLPALSLQPIVENAVRHGVTKKSKGGTVSIRTEETDEAFLITVKDDGVGFDLNEKLKIESGKLDANGHAGVGIKNVSSRLAVMCKGTLEIESTPGEGTTAVITIPK